MGQNNSSSTLDICGMRPVVDDFLAACCHVESTTACQLNDLALALALFMLQQPNVRRDLAGRLDEPNYSHGRSVNGVVYDLHVWHNIARRCLLHHLPRYHGIHIVSGAPGYIVTLGVRVEKWPSSVTKTDGRWVIIVDTGGAATDFLTKPFTYFT